MQQLLKYLLFCWAIALPAGTAAQTNEGTEFWFGFMHHHDPGQNQMVAMITSKYSTSGMIRMPGYNWEQAFSVAANSVTIVSLPANAESTNSEVLEKRGIQVVTQLPSSVYIHQYFSMRSEATVVLPVRLAGRRLFCDLQRLSGRGCTRLNFSLSGWKTTLNSLLP
ncbi:MAG: hypothetical protein IPK76_08580 [Lewinellaceae bacterium]|nr:hypothetical protein [Lewinellaceae bacterium]